MSHHFDTQFAKEDPSLNLCDLYLFAGAPGTTVMAMTVNPDVGLSSARYPAYRRSLRNSIRFGRRRSGRRRFQVSVQ